MELLIINRENLDELEIDLCETTASAKTELIIQNCFDAMRTRAANISRPQIEAAAREHAENEYPTPDLVDYDWKEKFQEDLDCCQTIRSEIIDSWLSCFDYLTSLTT